MREGREVMVGVYIIAAVVLFSALNSTPSFVAVRSFVSSSYSPSVAHLF